MLFVVELLQETWLEVIWKLGGRAFEQEMDRG